MADTIHVRVRTNASDHRRRAGLILTRKWGEHDVTAAQLAELRADSSLDVIAPGERHEDDPRPAAPADDGQRAAIEAALADLTAKHEALSAEHARLSRQSEEQQAEIARLTSKVREMEDALTAPDPAKAQGSTQTSPASQATDTPPSAPRKGR